MSVVGLPFRSMFLRNMLSTTPPWYSVNTTITSPFSLAWVERKKNRDRRMHAGYLRALKLVTWNFYIKGTQSRGKLSLNQRKPENNSLLR